MVTTARDCSSPVLASRGRPPLTRQAVRAVIRLSGRRRDAKPRLRRLHVDTRTGARAFRLVADPGENEDLATGHYVLGLGRPNTLFIFRKTRGPQ